MKGGVKLKNRFNVVPIETDTRILYQQEGKLCGYDIRYEIWSWDGIEAGSIIFFNDDVAGLTDQEIKKVVLTSGLINEGSTMTLNRSDSGYTFCNFNFE